jgi:hypothetical protein
VGATGIEEEEENYKFNNEIHVEYSPILILT